VPQDYADGNSRSCELVTIPVCVDYTLQAGSSILQVKMTLDNTAKDHWLRACSATGLKTDVSVSDAHFDVVERPIPLPDSRGWVERAYGMQPLQTFADVSDGEDGLAVLPKGLFEYEAIDDPERTLALTLIRACRIKLAVSEEKMTELPDEGVQCPGKQTFEYALCPHAGDWRAANLSEVSNVWNTPVRAMQIGRGKGDLPLENSLFTLKGQDLNISSVQPLEKGIQIRLFNVGSKSQIAELTFGQDIQRAALCKMDDSELQEIEIFGNRTSIPVGAKKIATVHVDFM